MSDKRYSCLRKIKTTRKFSVSFKGRISILKVRLNPMQINIPTTRNCQMFFRKSISTFLDRLRISLTNGINEKKKIGKINISDQEMPFLKQTTAMQLLLNLIWSQ